MGLDEVLGCVGDVDGLRADGAAVEEAGAAGMPPQYVEDERSANARAGGGGGEGQAGQALDESRREVGREHAAPQEQVSQAEKTGSVPAQVVTKI